MPSRPLVRGVYVPVVTFFNDDKEQSLDLESHKTHILWLARAGIHGFVVQGSTAEAVALNPIEKNQVGNHFPDLLMRHDLKSTRSATF